MDKNDLRVIHETVELYRKSRFRLMDIARGVHARLGYLSEEIVGEIGNALGIQRVEVRDMTSFYAFFSPSPKGKNVVRLAYSVVERMMGAEEVAKAFEDAAGVCFGETSPDGLISLEYAPCIGLSDQAPSALVNGIPVTHLRPCDVSQMVESIRKGKVFGPSDRQGRVESNLRQPGPVVFSPSQRGAAIRRALNMEPKEVIAEINKSRLRGRGGAGFPTAMKWDFCRKNAGETHYVICNADEGEPGTFKDRVILTERPDLVFEGMTVAGYVLGAQKGLLYLRAEYEYLREHLEQILAKRRRLGILGEDICGREGFNFDIQIQLGAGAYICGEESALIESLEGKRGAPRDRPPFPVQQGYLGQPTSVNNVETFCCAARIIEEGAEWFSGFGTQDSTGTKLLSVSGDCDAPGVYELEYGTTVETLLEKVGGENAEAVQVGGASGQCIAPKDFGRSISFEDLPTGGSVIVFGPDRDVLEYMRQFVEFFVHESCGWCAPCRVGTTILLKKLEKVLNGRGTSADLAELERLGNTIKTMSRCGLGQTAANPVLTTLRNLPGLYDKKIQPQEFIPSFDLSKALEEGCAITGRTSTLEEGA